MIPGVSSVFLLNANLQMSTNLRMLARACHPAYAGRSLLRRAKA